MMMSKELTNSTIERQNVLNNPFAVTEIKKAVDLRCIFFEDRNWLNKEQIASFFEVDVRTIERYLEKYGDELRLNGYEVLRGNRLKLFKLTVKEQFDTDIGGGIKTQQLGIFDFKVNKRYDHYNKQLTRSETMD